MNFFFLKKPTTSFIIGLIIFIVVLILGLALFEYLRIFNNGYSLLQEDWGSFGDFIGGIGGTLLSLVAVFLIFFTYLLQKKELEKTTLALNAQNEQLEIQQYQNMLFRLLERKDKLLNNISRYSESQDLNHGSGETQYELLKGISVLRIMTYSFNKKTNETQNERDKALKSFWNSYQNKLTIFFDSFFSTINYLTSFEAKNAHQERVKSQLIKLYASNLSSEEIETLNILLEYHHKFTGKYSKRDMENCIKAVWKYHVFILNDYLICVIDPSLKDILFK